MSKHKRPPIRRTAEQTLSPEQLRVWCHDCSAWSYAVRDHTSDERRQLRRDHPGESFVAYRCHTQPTRWHIGRDILRDEEQRRYYLAHGVAMGDK